MVPCPSLATLPELPPTLCRVAKSSQKAKPGQPSNHPMGFEPLEKARPPGFGSGTAHCRRLGNVRFYFCSGASPPSVRKKLFHFSFLDLGGPILSWPLGCFTTAHPTRTAIPLDGGCVSVPPTIFAALAELSQERASFFPVSKPPRRPLAREPYHPVEAKAFIQVAARPAGPLTSPGFAAICPSAGTAPNASAWFFHSELLRPAWLCSVPEPNRPVEKKVRSAPNRFLRRAPSEPDRSFNTRSWSFISNHP